MKEEKNWFVANDKGELIAHDISESIAKTVASDMQEKEPDAGWEALKND
jgi:hypothetical protein